MAAETAPKAVEYWPAKHMKQLLDPWAVEYVPARHSWHALELLAPLAVRNVPAEQSSQTAEDVAPLTVENVPATHDTHADMLATFEYCPAEQSSQTAEDVAPLTVENVPATHDTHADMFATLEYCPAAQGVQALSWWGAQIVDVKDPAGHIWQVLQYCGPVITLSRGLIRLNSEPDAGGPRLWCLLDPSIGGFQPPNQT